ncbi:MAG: cytochrome c oxidase subunit II transmembrane domain-containing protein, partial [Polyangiaceae bacterium]
MSPTTIFSPAATPARWISELSTLIFAVTAAIFVVVFTLLAYALIKYRARRADDLREPPQVYGSTQIELAWTIIPILIVIVLFLASARVIASTQAAPPQNALEVTVVGHQFWWEFRYPGLGVVTANELHVPVSKGAQRTPTLLRLESADTVHSFWVPRLSGKTDLIPN